MTIKQQLEARKNKLIERRDAVTAQLVTEENAETRAALGKTLEALRDDINELDAMLATIDDPATDAAGADNGAAEGRSLNPVAAMTMRTGAPAANDNAAAEQRAQAFANSGTMTIDNADARAVLVSSGQLATPTEVHGINDPVGVSVSSIVDLVNIVDASGMGAYNVAYVDEEATAAAQAEGGDYVESDPVFGYVEIKPESKGVISYISRQARKQTPLKYEQKVHASALTALKKEAAKKITTSILASEITTKLSLAALDEKTLRIIAFNYGGDESIVGAATLFINKADLVALGDVRGSDKKPVYKITPDTSNPNTGIIEDGGLAVHYCLNSNLAAGKLIYGQGKRCDLALFSNYEVAVSEDFKFNKGLLTIRGDVDFGCGVTAKGGFVVATVGA